MGNELLACKCTEAHKYIYFNTKSTCVDNYIQILGGESEIISISTCKVEQFEKHWYVPYQHAAWYNQNCWLYWEHGASSPFHRFFSLHYLLNNEIASIMTFVIILGTTGFVLATWHIGGLLVQPYKRGFGKSINSQPHWVIAIHFYQRC